MRIDIRDINLKEKIKDFSQYLATTDRIILSAKFGDGKTYLLNQLREDERLCDEYKFFTIYPVNYSVAKNEDVFEYIKRDIIIQLKKENLLDKVDFDAVFDSLFDFNDIQILASFLLSFVPGGELYDKIFKKICEKRKEYNEKKRTADKYLTSFSQIEGCVYENDGYTTLIKNAIGWIKEDHSMSGFEWKKKKAVLIIEDLDRLDPKHLFRILNVLSAHIDDTSTPDVITNKFGFNNIVLVMDYETTKHIFHHFYGSDACYEGYMSKFLSREPFRYSIQPFIVVEIERKIFRILGVTNIFHIFSKFRERLSQLSIRELKKLTLFDTQDRIKSQEYECYNMKFSTSLPLFHLIIYMVECGMSLKDIVTDLNTKVSVGKKEEMGKRYIEFMRLMYPLYAIHGKGSLEYVEYGLVHYSVSEEKNNGVITDVVFHPTLTWGNPIVKMNNRNIEDTIRWCLENFSSSINLAAL